MNLMCVELAKSPSGVSRMVRIICFGISVVLWDCGFYNTSLDTMPSLAPPPIRR